MPADNPPLPPAPLEEERIERLINRLLNRQTEEITNKLESRITAAINKELSTLQTKVESLEDSVESLQTKVKSLHREINDKDELICDLEERVKNLEVNVIPKVVKIHQKTASLESLVYEKTDTQEAYSRRCCLRISGLKSIDRESDDALQTRIITELSTHGVTISATDIYRLHPIGKPHSLNKFKEYCNYANDSDHQLAQSTHDTLVRDIIVRFTNWRARTAVYAIHYSKNQPIRVNLCLTKYREDLLKDARSFIKANNFKGYVFANEQCEPRVVNATTNHKQSFFGMAALKEFCVNMSVDASFHANKKRTRPSADNKRPRTSAVNNSAASQE